MSLRIITAIFDHEWITSLRINHSSKIVRKNKSNFIARKYSLIKLYPLSKIALEADIDFGVKQLQGSKMETRLLIESDAEFQIKKRSVIYSGSYIRIMKWGKLILDGCIINEDVQITCGDIIYIGQNSFIGRGVVIRSYDSHVFAKRGLTKSASIFIGSNVWIGQNAIIYKGISIGDNSIIGAGCIVTENVLANSKVGNLI